MKPISTVQLSVPRLGLVILDHQSDKALADWVRSFHRALSTPNPKLNEYAAELMQDVQGYRNSKAAYMRENRHNVTGSYSNLPEVLELPEVPLSVSQSVSHTDNKKEETQGASPPRVPRVKFQKPTLEELTAYIREHGYKTNPLTWLAHYESNGWVVGRARAPMKNWKATVVTWEQRGDFSNNGQSGRHLSPAHNRNLSEQR